MSIESELKYLEKVQQRCIRFADYLEAHDNGRYDDLIRKLSSLVGVLEDTIYFDVIEKSLI